MINVNRLHNWSAPDHWQRIEVLDMHTAGEPLRIFTRGFPTPPGSTMLERRQACLDQYDSLRTATLWEPRGHADMYGCLLTPPERPTSDFGVLFLHNEGYSTMCGHAVIAVAQAAVQCGLVTRTAPETQVTIDTPAGQVCAWVDASGLVRFHNVPAFVQQLDLKVNIAGLGELTCDIAYGGAYYALVDAADVNLALGPENVPELIRLGTAIKSEVSQRCQLHHPGAPELGFIYGTIFTSESASGALKNVCVFAAGEVDRSPTGTGVSARLALAHARGQIGLDEPREFVSIIKSRLGGRIVQTTRQGDRPAVITEVSGRAYITGQNQLLLDPDDPLMAGFFLR